MRRLRWRRLAALALAALVALSLPGCKAGTQDEEESPTVEKGNVAVDNTELDGFYAMMQSEVATKEHALGDVTKVLLYENRNMLILHEEAIDIGNKRMFTEPMINSMLDYDEPDYHMTDADVDEVRAILERNDVLAWAPVYGKMIDPGEGAVDDSGGWFLYLQYSDNTVSRFCGNGEYPDTYGSFIEELTDFVDSKK